MLQRLNLLVALLWFLVPVAWRIASSIYIDVAGPVFTDQLSGSVGPGRATGLLALDYLVTILVFALIVPLRFGDMPPKVADFLLGPQGKRLRNLFFFLALIFIVGCFAEMLWIGSIPLFSGIERYDYTNEYAGPLHRLLFRFGDVFALYLGCSFALPRLLGRSADFRSLFLLLAIFTYAFLTGHRYSAFFKFAVMFALPCAILFPDKLVHAFRHVIRTRFATYWGMLSVPAIVVLMITIGVINSYFSVRFQYDDYAWQNVKERVLVQQAELWWLSYQRVVEFGSWNAGEAFSFLFSDAIDATRNTTMQYLMYLALGHDALRVVEMGQQYTGGFPEIFHELLGPSGGFMAIAFVAFIPAIVLRVLLVSLSNGRIFTTFWAALVLYPLLIMYWGGMLNFVLAWTFWVKVAGLVAAWIIESKFGSTSPGPVDSQPKHVRLTST